MKVILLQDVANIGKRFEVADVPTGHALNMLIPRGMAEPATPENLKRVEARRTRAATMQSEASATFADVVSKIKGSTQEVAFEANEQGHLFQGLKADLIAGKLGELGFAVTADQVQLSEPLKEVGEHEITLSDGEQKATFTLKVVAA